MPEYTFNVESKQEINDGYHTFKELYDHRKHLFAVICNTYKEKAWKSFLHHDGSRYHEYFIVGIETPHGSFTYHYHQDDWHLFEVMELERAPEWDGHTSDDVVRLHSLLNSGD